MGLVLKMLEKLQTGVLIATGRICQGKNALLSDSDRSMKQIEEQRAAGRSMAEPYWRLPFRGGLNLFPYRNIGIMLPAMYMNSRGNLKLTEDRAKTEKEIFCFNSTCPF